MTMQVLIFVYILSRVESIQQIEKFSFVDTICIYTKLKSPQMMKEEVRDNGKSEKNRKSSRKAEEHECGVR